MIDWQQLMDRAAKVFGIPDPTVGGSVISLKRDIGNLKLGY